MPSPSIYEFAGGEPAFLALATAHDELVSCFVQAADDAGLPDDPALRACLRAYMEWAVGDVLSYSPRGSVVPDRPALPHWSWSGLM